MIMRVHLLKGLYDGYVVDISKQPSRILIDDYIYERIDDPETGEFLGAYVCLSR
jgi:hypothetical protein